jgi:hypothetical protein
MEADNSKISLDHTKALGEMLTHFGGSCRAEIYRGKLIEAIKWILNQKWGYLTLELYKEYKEKNRKNFSDKYTMLAHVLAVFKDIEMMNSVGQCGNKIAWKSCECGKFHRIDLVRSFDFVPTLRGNRQVWEVKIVLKPFPGEATSVDKYLYLFVEAERRYNQWYVNNYDLGKKLRQLLWKLENPRTNECNEVSEVPTLDI